MSHDAPTQLRRCERPCRQCPWRRDTPAGKFGAERYAALEETAGVPGAEAPLGASLFACHMSAEDAERACAGWLAVAGYEHLGVRLAVVTGRLPAEALAPGPGWPELHSSYAEMARAQGRPPEG